MQQHWGWWRKGALDGLTRMAGRAWGADAGGGMNCPAGLEHCIIEADVRVPVEGLQWDVGTKAGQDQQANNGTHSAG